MKNILSKLLTPLKKYQYFVWAWLLTIPYDTFAQSNNFLKSNEDFMLLYLLVLVVFMCAVLVPVLGAIVVMTQVLTKDSPEDAWFDFDKLWLNLANLKPLSKEKELLLDEDYDGIQELNNPVPAWFNLLFFGTIAFGLLYWLVYHTWEAAPQQAQEYESEVYAAQALQHERLKNAPPDNVNEENVKLLTDVGVLNAGKGTYIQYCAACHGKVGEGMVGPNLADEYWLHGGTIKDVFRTIKNGVTDKGMVAWGTQLTPTQISNTANYILSLKGTNPPNAKAPQGEKVQ